MKACQHKQDTLACTRYFAQNCSSRKRNKMSDVIASLLDPLEAIALMEQNRAIMLDATFYLPSSGLNAAEAFAKSHIEGARRFDIDAIADPDSIYPHTMPSAELFAQAMQALGVNNEDHIIVYDNSPFLSCARAWWMLRYFGHDAVSILNGGLSAWQAAGGQVNAGQTNVTRGNFSVRPSSIALAKLDQVRSIVQGQTQGQLVDARSPGRFTGDDPEPRPGMASGHMPGAINLPISELLNLGQVRPLEEIRDKIELSGIDCEAPIITTCGSGVTACGLAFAFHLLGLDDVAMYDGSWAEWGHAGQDRVKCPVATGAKEA